MGKVVIIFVLVIISISGSLLVGVFERSKEVPKMLNGNFQDIGSYTLQYAINQVITGKVIDNATVNYGNNNMFEVLDGNVNSIEYRFYSTTTTADYLPDDPEIEGEDDGTFVYDLTGTLNINPGTSDNNEFVMETPTEGYEYVDRTEVHKNAPCFSYCGPATVVKVKPKAQGRTVQVNGVEIELSPNARYTIRSQSMMVDLWNDHEKNGKAMGQWWITIDAEDAVLELDPGIPLENFVEDTSWMIFESLTHTVVDIIANVSMNVQDKTLTHNCRAGAVIVLSETKDVNWWTVSVNEEESSYKIIYWNP
ncbi:MAG: hypothetical protein APR54_08765 [Candidatus Cloacimonas sp. SDB]|nr:MAG: hypothetical protein APR54_08765 [Candidatus Cloacimonas sp. SDB]